MERVFKQSLEGVLKPFKVAPIGTGMIITGLFLGYDGLNNISSDNFFFRWSEFALGFASLGTGFKSFAHAYSSYFRSLKHISKFERLDERYAKLLIKPNSKLLDKNPCLAIGYKAAAEIVGYKKEYNQLIKDIK